MIGDKVKFKSELPELEHHSGWALDPEWEEGNPETLESSIQRYLESGSDPPIVPVIVTWNEKFGGLSGVVVNEDPTNRVVAVRGFDKGNQEFYLWIDPSYLEVTKAAMDFSDG